MASSTRPLDPDGLPARLGPFAAALLAVFALVSLERESDNALAVLATASVAIGLVLAVGVLPWRRLPAWAHALPPAALFVLVGLLREIDGGAESVYTPLLLLPVLWFSLYGRRRDVLLGTAGVAATIAGPIVPVGPPTDPAGALRISIVWIVVALFVGLTVQRLVFELRERAESLAKAARTDPLTGLANRRAWEEALARELARARELEIPLSLALLDLDRFKLVNDRDGHRAGDRLLRELAAAWAGRVRATDTLARYGGDEFAALFPACPLERATTLLDGFQETLPAGMSASIGLVCWDGHEAKERLLERVDQALYAAKRNGGARTVTDGDHASTRRSLASPRPR